MREAGMISNEHFCRVLGEKKRPLIMESGLLADNECNDYYDRLFIREMHARRGDIRPDGSPLGTASEELDESRYSGGMRYCGRDFLKTRFASGNA
jgi:hypothetical protein